jgi:multicomponent Na+:H+ antiporter subunit G
VGVEVRDVVVAALLAAGVLVQLLCAVGVVAMRDVFDRLHYVGPASAVGPFLFAAAALVEDSFSQPGVKALVVALLLAVTSPVLSHATARALRVRQFDHWRALPGEIVDDER